jgi:hypothetical protein
VAEGRALDGLEEAAKHLSRPAIDSRLRVAANQLELLASIEVGVPLP